MIKSYDEMFAINVEPYCKKRDNALYLPWGRCKQLLHENGAETVYFEPLYNSNGSSLFMCDKEFTDKNGNVNQCYEVRIRTVVDDKEWVTNYPLMNGANPVKDNSMSQLRVNNAQARAFVKGVAIHTGLGFSLWVDEDDSVSDEEDLSKHNIFAIKKRVEQTISSKLSKGMSKRELVSALGMSGARVDSMLKAFDEIAQFERALNGI